MRIGVLTSGGDAQGMNAALRAAVRRGLALGAEVVGIHEGYAGMVAGGEKIVPVRWGDVSRILHLGGTHFGTARAPAFREPEGRRTAVLNLLHAGVDRLAVIGGDGSLTGASVLCDEWAGHLSALVEEGRVSADVAAAHPVLRVVGMVGSIDNDLWGTDRTIGCDSALHRIVDAVDTLTSTARSHQRSFVVEVMGRHCGFLALAAAVCTGADYLLIPEAPRADWRNELVNAVRAGRALGKRKAIVIVAEGATDIEGRDIESNEVQEVLEAELEVETRVTVLGHVQRGGAPTAYDRVMSTILGARGAEVLLKMGPRDEPMVMATWGDRVFPRPLRECLTKTREIATAIRTGDHARAVEERGPEFAGLLSMFDRLSHEAEGVNQEHPKRLLLVQVGAPAPGMNAATRAFVRMVKGLGHIPLVALDGLRGLLADQVSELGWADVSGIASLGSTILGTRRGHHGEPGELAAAVRRHKLDGVVVSGGFEALAAARELGEAGVPVAVVPATISNNVPGSDPVVGVDTALNVICEAVDTLKQSAIGSRDRVFVVEVMGRRCGYLATVAGLGSGAEIVYTHESGVSLERLRNDVASLAKAYDDGRSVSIVLMADKASDVFDANALARIFEAESGGRFDTRVCVLGHLQQGGRPAPQDRLLAVRLVSHAVTHLTEGTGQVLVGIVHGDIEVVPVASLASQTDPVNRRPSVPPYADWADVAESMRG